jgi:hypothetical protein
MYIRRPGVLPVISMHLAVLHIQKLFRGRRARARVQQLKTQQLSATTTTATTAPSVLPSDSKDEKQLTNDNGNGNGKPRVRRPLYARYFAETGLTHIASGGHDGITPQYQHWAARYQHTTPCHVAIWVALKSQCIVMQLHI